MKNICACFRRCASPASIGMLKHSLFFMKLSRCGGSGGACLLSRKKAGKTVSAACLSVPFSHSAGLFFALRYILLFRLQRSCVIIQLLKSPVSAESSSVQNPSAAFPDLSDRFCQISATGVNRSMFRGCGFSFCPEAAVSGADQIEAFLCSGKEREFFFRLSSLPKRAVSSSGGQHLLSEYSFLFI